MTEHQSDVVVTGLGVVSPLGCTAGELARRVAAGERAPAGPDGTMIETIPLDVVPAAARTRIGRLDRVCRLALAAAYLAVDDAALPLPLVAPERVGLLFGTGLGCLLSDAEFFDKIVAQGPAAASPRVFAYTVSSAAAGEVSIALGVHGPNATLHMGLAAGAGALGQAADLIRTGRADVVLAGGADAHDAPLAAALRDMGLLKGPEQARPFVDAVPGLWPSEGAVVAVLERAGHAVARGARVRARLAAHAAGFEPTLTSHAPQPDGLTAVLRQVVEAGPQPALVLASAHGTPLDAVERAALAAAGLGEVPVVAPKAALGDAFGASSALAAALATAWLANPVTLAPGVVCGNARTPHTAGPILISALCPGGSTAALLLTA